MKNSKRIASALLSSALLFSSANAQAPACQESTCTHQACHVCGEYVCHDICEAIFWTARPETQSTPAPQNTPCALASNAPKPNNPYTPAPQRTKAPVENTGDYTTESLYTQEQKAWNLLNADRARNGLAPLPLDSALSAIAREKSRDMALNGYFAHHSPTYGYAKDMLKSFGYLFSAVGENIAHHATVEKSQAAFMSSDGHKRNILSASWQKVGIGVYTDAQGYVYVTQLFVR